MRIDHDVLVGARISKPMARLAKRRRVTPHDRARL
jgi:hypothetical protein